MFFRSYVSILGFLYVVSILKHVFITFDITFSENILSRIPKEIGVIKSKQNTSDINMQKKTIVSKENICFIQKTCVKVKTQEK